MKTEEIEDITIIIPEEMQIDVNNSPKFGSELGDILQDKKKVILELLNINFIDSTGLGIIVSTLRDMKKSNGLMVLCGANQAVRVLFDMVRLSQITSIYKDRDEALEALMK